MYALETYAVDRVREMLAERHAAGLNMSRREYEYMVENHAAQLRELIKYIPPTYNDAAVSLARYMFRNS